MYPAKVIFYPYLLQPYSPMKRFLLSLAALVGTAGLLQAEPVQVGENAPVVVGITETGDSLNLGEVYAQNEYTLVYFYPKAFTKGCTDQGCSLRDAYEELTAKGVAVIGVSVDTVEDQKAFKEENHLPFTLIADADRTVINAFGVPVDRVASRQAYLVRDGKIVYADYKGTTTEQAAVILDFIAKQAE